MTLLTCAKKNRTQIWQRYHRSTMRRNALAARKKSVTAGATATVLAQNISTTAATSTSVSVASEKGSIPIPIPSDTNNNSSSLVNASGDVASPWRALFLAFFAMIQPEPVHERLEMETAFLDDLSVRSVPSRVSDVLDGEELFWRYDMDSYAANNRNEDRSQYILDTIESPEDNNATSSVFFCGCYDGHGGEEAVEYVQRNLYKNIKQHLLRGENVSDAIVCGFQDTDEAFHRQSMLQFEKGLWSACSVGACAVIAMVVDQKLYVASCGDCRAIMAFRDPQGSLSVEQITWDHTANDQREQERLRMLYPEDYDIVREVGVQNFYVKGRLQPTRSLGDTYMKMEQVNRAPMPRGLRIRGSFKRPYITAVPDVFEVDLADRQPEFLVLGSDGLYGEMTNEEIAQTIDSHREQRVENVSESLRTVVLARIAKYYGFSSAELAEIAPGERRNYHDDITIDVLHFIPPAAVVDKAALAA